MWNVTKIQRRQKSQGGKSMDVRKWTFRIVGVIVALLGGFVLLKGYESVILITVATILIIVGVSLWMAATPESYNAGSSDMVMMIDMGQPKKIEDIYEAYKNVETPLGSAWLGKLYTMRAKAMIFGPTVQGEYLYFWLARNGKIGYLGYSNLDNFIRKQLTQPVIPLKKGTGNGTKDYFIITDLQKELKGNMEYYIKTGKVLPFSKMSL